LVAAAAAAGVVLTLGAGAASGREEAKGGAGCQSVAVTKSAWVNCMLDSMSAQAKVGQMFGINAYGETVNASDSASVAANNALFGPSISNLQDLISTYDPGEVIYFNFSNTLAEPQQVAQLSRGVQDVAIAQPTPTPALISTDQEEGEVLRISTPATVFPGNLALGATRSTHLAFRNAAITGRELRAMGVNVDNAPVVDVNVNPKNTVDGPRAFGDRPGFVSRYARAQVEGYQGPGEVAAVAKHWPGLGDTTTNPDTGITVSPQTLAQLKKENFPPFRAAIKAGVDQIMVTTVLVPKVVQGVPADLSHRFVDGLLRKQLNYHGVIVTDALNAQALASYSPAQIALMAIQAGDDVLLWAAGPDTSAQSGFVPAYNAVLDAVTSGQIPISRIDQSVKRILGLKWKLGLASDPYSGIGNVNNRVGTPAHLSVATRTTNRSITLLRNRQRVLPLRAKSGDRVLVAGWGQSSTPLIANQIRAHGLTAQSFYTGQTPTEAQIQQATAKARGYDSIVVDTFDAFAPGFTRQIKLVNALAKTGTPVIVMSIGSPYDAANLPKADAFVATYDYQPVSVSAGVAALFGNINLQGKLPVTIPRASRPNQVLYPFGFGLSYGSRR
jgi:beta-N-acetylhexosaminidase